jgi:hypothetical protein
MGLYQSHPFFFDMLNQGSAILIKFILLNLILVLNLSLIVNLSLRF